MKQKAELDGGLSAKHCNSEGELMTNDTPIWWVFYRPHDLNEAEPLEVEELGNWTCNQATQSGDFALLYVLRPTSALIGVLQATTKATRSRDAGEFTVHPWVCDVKVVSLFEHPLTIDKLRKDNALYQHWGILRGNFQPPGGRPPVVPVDVLPMLARLAPELKQWIASQRQGSRRKPGAK